jgi:hypothetical protein
MFISGRVKVQALSLSNGVYCNLKLICTFLEERIVEKLVKIVEKLLVKSYVSLTYYICSRDYDLLTSRNLRVKHPVSRKGRQSFPIIKERTEEIFFKSHLQLKSVKFDTPLK